jgi:Ribbon-helix-helix protein, copG family
MSKPASKADQFLAAMQKSEIPEPVPPAPVAKAPAETAAAPAAVVHELPRSKAAKAAAPTRAGLKHFGGYLDDESLEKIALLRIRLKKDNSELIKQAIDDLYRKHNAKRAFGDA